MPLTGVADSLGIPIGTVKSRLHRALGDMRIAITDASADDHRVTVPGGQLA
jgi:DNA-directed RNA polymerase specialized sigma24 family protein